MLAIHPAAKIGTVDDTFNSCKGTMMKLRKHLFASLIAAGIAAASVGAYAAGPDCGPMGGGHAFGGRSPEQMQAHFEKRQTELRDKLKLNANQQTAWNTFITKMKPTEPMKRPDRAELDKLSAPERMEKMRDAMQEGEKRMSDRIAATKEFYAVLTPEQQKVFNDEFRFGGRHGMHQRRGERH